MGLFSELTPSNFIPQRDYSPTQQERARYSALISAATDGTPATTIHKEEGVRGWQCQRIEDIFPGATEKTKSTFHVGEVMFCFFRDGDGFFIQFPL